MSECDKFSFFYFQIVYLFFDKCYNVFSDLYIFPLEMIVLLFKAQLLDSFAVDRALRRISFEIIEKNRGTENICIIGIQRRGVCIAEQIRANILNIEGVDIPTGTLDITHFRDDLSGDKKNSEINTKNIPFDITGKKVILTDDVLYTGRTVRAAIDALFALGRPSCIQFAALIDRGHRELPIKADYVGKNIPTSHNEVVKVTFSEYDNCETAVSIYEKTNN